jgi:EmrB/QacA subfamily drug resistance transporter
VTGVSETFEAERPRLLGLSYRLVAGRADAEDVVQEAWLRWSAADHGSIANPPGWLTTVTTRIALDRMRQVQRRREDYVGPWLPEPVSTDRTPEERAELAESLTLGFLVMLDRLSPLERAVFLLADVFAEPYSVIAPAVGKSEVACRQIASRSRRKVQAAAAEPGGPRSRPAPAELLAELLVALMNGDEARAVQLLDPDVVLVSDGGPDRHAARRPVVGAYRVHRLLTGGWRLLFTIGLVIFTVGSLLCGLAQTPLMLVLSRSGQGIGGAIMFATSLALLGNSFRGRDRGVAFGVWGAITGIAVSLGPILGGVITTGISWRGIFLVNVPIGVAAVVVTWQKVEESRAADPGRPDWAGFVLLTTGLVGVVYGLIRASETSWSDPGVLVSLVLGAVLLAGFIGVEAVVTDPMFDLALFRVPTFDAGLVAAFCMNGSLFAIFLYLVLYLQDLLGYSALATGLRFLVISGAMLIAATVSGRLSEYVPVRWLIGPGLLLVSIGLFMMSGLHATSQWTHLIPGFIVAGIGSGLVNPPLASTAIGVVPPERAGMASGVNSTFRQIGLAMSIAAFGTIFISAVQRMLHRALSPVPQLSAHAHQIVTALRQGRGRAAIGNVPSGLRHQLQVAIKSSFSGGINDLLIVSGVVALVGAVVSVLFIRNKDFVARRAESATQPEPARGGVASTA